MRVIKTCEEFLQLRNSLDTLTVGFVPTMGALHNGHRSLLKKARAANETLVLSIFVNPTQFNDTSDFKNYPSPKESDLEIAQSEGVDFVFMPNEKELYHDGYQFQILETELSKELCGKFRPGHFQGMLTVVLKLLMIVRPKFCYFGEKDYQQLLLVRKMISAFFLQTNLVPCPTVREPDGLAMSSRNVRLSSEERRLAPNFFRILMSGVSVEVATRDLERIGFQVEYVQDIDGRRFGGVNLGKVRLIDNVEI